MFKKIKFFLYFVFNLSLPMIGFAAGLVPCGGLKQPECNACFFIVLVNRVVSFLTLKLVLPAGVIALIVAGVVILTAGGDTNRLAKGKNILKNAVIGLVLVFASWLIVKTIMGNFLKEGYVPWNNFPNCPSVSSSLNY